ncbi:MAG: hypothetical protein ACYSR6_03935 [Planctomycetota bacterium]
MRRLSIIGILLIMVLGCSEDETPVSLTPPPSGLQISASVSPNRILLGQSSQLTLTIENYGPDIELDYDCAEHFGFRIEDADGSLTLTYPLCLPDEHTFVIRRGFKRTIQYPIPYAPIPALQPARYIISGGILEHEAEHPLAKTELVILLPVWLPN